MSEIVFLQRIESMTGQEKVYEQRERLLLGRLMVALATRSRDYREKNKPSERHKESSSLGSEDPKTMNKVGVPPVHNHDYTQTHNFVNSDS